MTLWLCEFAGDRLIRLGTPDEWTQQTLVYLDLLWGEECDVFEEGSVWSQLYLGQTWATVLGLDAERQGPSWSELAGIQGRRTQAKRREAYARAYLAVVEKVTHPRATQTGSEAQP